MTNTKVFLAQERKKARAKEGAAKRKAAKAATKAEKPKRIRLAEAVIEAAVKVDAATKVQQQRARAPGYIINLHRTLVAHRAATEGVEP